MMGDKMEKAPEFNFDVFERATEVMALWIARFRSEDAEITANDRLKAGLLAGALAANDLLVPIPPLSANAG